MILRGDKNISLSLSLRFVSVILGEAWRQLPADQKEVFISEAKALSSERKRLHPECWKRKRSQTSASAGVLKVTQANEANIQ